MTNVAEKRADTTSVSADSIPLGREILVLLRLAAPIIFVMLSRMLITTTDFIVVSRLGTEAIAAISPASLLVFILICLGMGPSTSIQTFVAQSLGRRDFRATSAYAWQGFYIAAVFFVLSWPINLLNEPFWKLFDQPAAIQRLEIEFCRIAFSCVGFSFICSSLEGFFGGVQRPMVCLVAILVSVVFNAVAAIVLVFGLFGFPNMGIRGAAIATVIAWAIRAVMLTAIFLSSEFNRSFHTRENWRFDIVKFRGILCLGGPVSAQWVLDLGAWWVFLTLLMARFGQNAMAASNVGLQLLNFSFMPAFGVGVALCSLVGHSIGEGRPDLAVRRARIGMLVNSLYMGAVGLTFLLVPGPLMGLFSSDAEVIRLGSIVLMWAAIFQLFDAAQITYTNALRGAGDTVWSAIIVTFHSWVVFIGGGYVIAKYLPEWGIHGPWMTCTLAIILLGLLLWWRWARGAWRKIDLFRDAPPVSTGFPVLPVDEKSAPPVG